MDQRNAADIAAACLDLDPPIRGDLTSAILIEKVAKCGLDLSYHQMHPVQDWLGKSIQGLSKAGHENCISKQVLFNTFAKGSEVSAVKLAEATRIAGQKTVFEAASSFSVTFPSSSNKQKMNGANR